MWYIHREFNTKIATLVLAVSALSTQDSRVRATTGWLGIRKCV